MHTLLQYLPLRYSAMRTKITIPSFQVIHISCENHEYVFQSSVNIAS